MARVYGLTQTLAGKGFDVVTAHAKALRMMAAGVDLQAAVMSFDDTFFATSVLVICSLPLVLLLGKSRPGGKVEMGH